MAFLLGRQAVCYWSTTLLNGSNTATILSNAIIGHAGVDGVAGNIMDLSLNVDSDFVDSTTRAEAAQGFKSQTAVLKNGELTFDARWEPGDDFFDALVDVWLGNTTAIALIALDQAGGTSGAQGLAANFTVGFSKTEPLQDIQKISVTLGIYDNPEWYVVP
jgi:hypothetical protein